MSRSGYYSPTKLIRKAQKKSDNYNDRFQNALLHAGGLARLALQASEFLESIQETPSILEDAPFPEGQEELFLDYRVPEFEVIHLALSPDYRVPDIKRPKIE